jgi:hypothetical protein
VSTPGIEKLKTEMREGIEHYVPGQHVAFAKPPEEGEVDARILLYVNALGWACVLVVERMEFDREHRYRARYGMQVSATGIQKPWKELPRDFQLSGDSVRALDNPEEV